MKIVRKRVVLSALAVLASIGLVSGSLYSDPAEAASPSSGFDASNIIDDSLFYDGNAMTSAEVQGFLNKQVPQCWLGRPGYEVGKVVSWGGTPTTLASKCTKDYVAATQSRAANAYCASYAGGGNETAAQIIHKVGKACGISQRVLLITLEKEQSLISDPWPNNEQYFRAMGYACPDSGPGGTANCDPSLGGFFQQVYRAAWQLKVYKAFPNSYNYKPFQNNYIQWHPNASCGGSTVNIQNWATAALYIYTPYRPNQAALNAGWGTGDSCSSYGNRNFYNFYKAWFGDPRGFNVWGDIATYWNARGAGSGIFGYPTGNSTLRYGAFSGGTWVQTFSGGVITTEMNTGKTVGMAYGKSYDHWNLVMGGLYGALGAPVSEAADYAQDGGAQLQWFQGGLTIAANSTGTVASVPFGDVYDVYNTRLGGIYGPLGYPVGNMTQYSGGNLQNFRGGFISHVSGSSQIVHMLKGPMFEYYNGVAGGIFGRLGFPVKDAVSAADGSVTQVFEGGALTMVAGGTVLEVSGNEAVALSQATQLGILLGNPMANRAKTNIGRGAVYQTFAAGIIVTPAGSKGAVAIGGSVYSLYNSTLGGFGGVLGYPTAFERPLGVSRGAIQTFDNGIVLAHGADRITASMGYDSPIYKRYNDVEGGIYGWLGYPTSDETVSGGVRSQLFERGRIEVDGAGRVVALPYETFAYYSQAGGAASALGAQVSASRTVEASGGGLLSFFKGALVTQIVADGRVAALRYDSPIYKRYNDVEGGIYGDLGFPVADETIIGSDSFQEFQHGRLVNKGGTVTRQ